jgi:hypothetical protein
MNRLVGILTAAVVVLATIWGYNKFSGKNVAQLGSGTAAV